MDETGHTSYHSDPKIDALVDETIARVADKWTLLLVEALGPAIERLSFARRPECAERCAHHAGW